jgi:predicted transcriptional regulator YdeE
MNYTISKQPAMLIAGFQTRIQDPETAPLYIGAFWDSFLNEKLYNKIASDTTPDQIVAVYSDYDGGGGYALLLGIQINEMTTIPRGIKILPIPEQKYALFSASGPLPSIVIDAWKDIEQSDLKRTFTYDIEMYQDRLNNQKNHVVNFYIAVK